MKMLKKKYLPLIIVGVLLIGAVLLNVRLNAAATAAESPEKTDTDTPAGEGVAIDSVQTDYFTQFRDERESVREKEIEYIDDVIATSTTDDETLAEATAMKLAIVENMEREFAIENLIRAKGFADAAVTMKSGSLNIVVDCEALSSEQVAQILDIAMRESGESAANIKIVSGKQ